MATRRKKTGFFKPEKQIKKELQGNLIESFAVVAGSLSTSAIYAKLQSKIPNPKVRKFMGAGTAVAGIALSATTSNNYAKAFGHGVTASGASKAVLDLAPPKIKMALGLGGLGAAPGDLLTPEELNEFATMEAEIAANDLNNSVLEGIYEDVILDAEQNELSGTEDLEDENMPELDEPEMTIVPEVSYNPESDLSKML